MQGVSLRFLALCLGMVVALSSVSPNSRAQSCTGLAETGLAHCFLGDLNPAQMLQVGQSSDRRHYLTPDYGVSFVVQSTKLGYYFSDSGPNSYYYRGFFARVGTDSDALKFSDQGRRRDYVSREFDERALGTEIFLLSEPRLRNRPDFYLNLLAEVASSRLEIADLDGGTRLNIVGANIGLGLGVVQGIGEHFMISGGVNYRLGLHGIRTKGQARYDTRQIAVSNGIALYANMSLLFGG